MLDLVAKIFHTEFEFEDFNQVTAFFKGLINVLKQMNYSEFESDDFKKYLAQCEEMIAKGGK